MRGFLKQIIRHVIGAGAGAAAAAPAAGLITDGGDPAAQIALGIALAVYALVEKALKRLDMFKEAEA